MAREARAPARGFPGIREARDPERFLDQLFGLFSIVEHHGWPALSTWWRATLADAERSGTRQRVVRKGRRIGASTVILPVLAVCEALHGEHQVPINDIGFFHLFSVRKNEARKRLPGIAKVLDVLGIKYHLTSDELALADRPVVFKVQAASFRTAVGDTSIGAWCDELARWIDADSGANPASEVLSSLRPALATQPNSKLWLVSSPLSNLDAHSAAFEEGDTNTQRVYFCPTWVGNPTLTEEATRALEPDDRVWRREFAAIPQASISNAFDPVVVEKAFRKGVLYGDHWESIGLVDASSGGGDSFSFGVAHYSRLTGSLVSPHLLRRVPKTVHTVIDGRAVSMPSPDEYTCEVVTDQHGQPVLNPDYIQATRPVAVLSFIDSFDGRFRGSITGAELVASIAKTFRRFGVRRIVGDQRESFFLTSEFMRHGLFFTELSWTNESKREAVTRLKRLFAEESLLLPEREKLRKELASYSERVTPSGNIVYSARGTGKDDEVSLLLTFAMAELEQLVPGSPLGFAGDRAEVSGR